MLIGKVPTVSGSCWFCQYVDTEYSVTMYLWLTVVSFSPLQFLCSSICLIFWNHPLGHLHLSWCVLPQLYLSPARAMDALCKGWIWIVLYVVLVSPPKEVWHSSAYSYFCSRAILASTSNVTRQCVNELYVACDFTSSPPHIAKLYVWLPNWEVLEVQMLSDPPLCMSTK